MTRMKGAIVAWLLLAAGENAWAQGLPPLEAYGRLPEVDLCELSPSGNRAVSRVTSNGRDLIVVFDLETMQPVTAADAADVNPRYIRFVDDDSVVLVAGQTIRTMAVRNSFDYSSAYSFDVNTKEIRVLLKRAQDMFPYQSGLGRIVGMDPGSSTVFMPAYIDTKPPSLGVYKARLDSSRARVAHKGNTHTIDWFLDADGEPLVREDFNDNANVHEIYVLDNDTRRGRLIYDEETALPSFSTVGLTKARDALVLLARNADTDMHSYFLMDLVDGSISGPVFEDPERDIAGVITDINRVVHGVVYSGFTPTYAFFDKTVEERVATIQRRLKGVSARLVSWTADFGRLMFEIEGGWSAGACIFFDDALGAPKALGQMRSSIDDSQVVPVEISAYEARDGLTIPALVTAREDVREAGPAPLIVMPHGGPRSYDRYGFDWMAQYFASRGYVVLQPQFRGSSGFGGGLLDAGDGEWGAKMQSDLDDGVDFLVAEGIADPDRVCIVGGSYGGYAALAAGAFSPDMYKCVVAFAPVTDIRQMLRQEKREHGKRDWVLDYWEKQVGAEESEKDILASISPAYHADAFKAPVLLLHGKNDTVVRIDQSKRMEKALRKAGKDVTFVQLKGEDHWLTQEETRIETLRAMAAFIEKHL